MAPRALATGPAVLYACLCWSVLCFGTAHARGLHTLEPRKGPSLLQQAVDFTSRLWPLTHHPDPSDDGTPATHWALLVAGSSGWWNYRHQSDVCHAYQVLRQGGLLPEHIVVMIYDDIAHDPNNPFPGQIFNRPGGPDVYEGVVVDYAGTAVNSQTVLAVLQGNRTAVEGLGSGKVIASRRTDRVFMFFSDHGAAGVLGMPSGNFLYADELHTAIKRKHAARGYKEMTLYIEACESGSMFEGVLGPELNVYATTASNAMESSWGTYCPGMGLSADPEMLDTCLGDLFSVSWMEDSECEDLTDETLKDQFEIVQQRTSNNYTYFMGSHAMQWGRTDIQKEHMAAYIGQHDASACMKPAAATSAANGAGHMGHVGHVLQRDADLVPLRVRVARARTDEDREQAQAALDAVLGQRQSIDSGLQAAATQLFTMRDVGHLMMTNLGWSVASVFQALRARGNVLAPSEHYVTELMTGHLGRHGTGQPLVDSWDCLREMVAAYTQQCGPMDQYSMRHTRLFANLCNAGVNKRGLEAALAAAGVCTANPSEVAAS